MICTFFEWGLCLELHVKKLLADAILPSFAKPDDAGFDLACSQTTELLPGERKAVPTGISIAVPKSHVGLILDRSGNALNKGLHCLGGVIDPGYRGEWKAIMINLGKEKIVLEKGHRIAQGLILPLAPVLISEVDELGQTERGASGFGSSGH